MKIARTATWALIAGAFLAGCSSTGSQSPTVPNPAMDARSAANSRTANLFPSMTLPPMVRPDRRRSWVSPDAARAKQLLFESDPGTDDVDMFSLPDMTHKGTLTGFKQPLGECSDRKGNVWIANFLKHELLEYSHKGTLLNKIHRAGLEPSSCAVNPVNGDIAVINYLSGSQTRSSLGLLKPVGYSNHLAQPPTVLLSFW